MIVEKELLQWEEITSKAMDKKVCTCERQDGFLSAWLLSKKLIHEGQFYLNYTSSFCLFQISTFNLVNELISKDEIDLAYEVFEESRSLFEEIINEESLPNDIRQHVAEEQNELFTSQIFTLSY